MFTSSIRRAVYAAQPASFVSAASASAPRAVSTQALALRQRRYSSSKPSSPADGPKGVADVPAPAQVKADGAKKKAKAQRKARDNKDVEYVKGLPSVPSTGHLQVKGAPFFHEIAASSFFSLHRPISVTSPFPKSVTDDTFAQIFAPRSRKDRIQDVLNSVNSTIQSFEQTAWNAEADQLRASINSQSDVTHLDGMPGDSNAIPFPQHIMQGRYQPFNAPPAPVPMDSAESLAAGLEAAQEEVQHRTYTATLTIEESTDSNGEITYTAHSTPLLDMEEPVAPRTFAERMQQRRQRFEEGREEQGTWQAISVKRQRKLKMKKHKYKKLMRRTRNLRRRLDRN